jgi:hypothetical protein
MKLQRSKPKHGPTVVERYDDVAADAKKQPPQRQNEIFSCENPFQRLLFGGATRIGAASSRFGAFLEDAGKVGR